MIFEISKLSELWIKCGKYNKWSKNNWNNWNGIEINTLSTMVLIVIEVIIINEIIVIAKGITTITIKIKLK